MRQLGPLYRVIFMVAVAGIGLASTGQLLCGLFILPASAQQTPSSAGLSDDTDKGSKLIWSDDTPFAVVELFTSEGCSSCPSADRNLSSIVERADKSKTRVFGLSYHVDYWNKLGWDDPYSLETATERQQIYARALGQDRVYTPQMIVNGTKQFVGSDSKQSENVIGNFLKAKPGTRIGLQVTPTDSGLTVLAKTENTQKNDLILVALVQDHGMQQVPRGENAGARLLHSNIVRDFRVAELTGEDIELLLRKPDDIELQRLKVIAFVQTRATAEITSAVLTDLLK